MTNKSNQRKIFSFVNFDLVNALIKDEALATSRNESGIVEDAILNRYLSGNKFLDYPIVCVLHEENGLPRAAENLFTQFAALPEYVDDSAFPLVSWLRNLEWHFQTDISKSRLDLTHFMRSIETFKDVIDNYLNRTDYSSRSILDVSGKTIFLDEFELKGSIRILSDILKIFNEGKNNYSQQDVLDVYNLLCRYWNLPLPDNRPLHKFSYVYRWLADVMRICNYPSLPEYRYDFVKMVRDINFYNK